MAEAVNKASEEASAAPVRPPVAPHGGRFTIAYLLILVVFGGVVGLFAYMLGRSSSEPWSEFKPKGDGLARANSIARHVSVRYRQDGSPIAVVEAQPPVAGNAVIDAIAIARDSSQGIGGGFSAIAPASNTLLYVFCGVQRDCSIPGLPSVERGELLRRQSLELALYTFKYLDDVDSVVTLLPPLDGVVPAVWLRKRALKAQLDRPLRKTLPGQPPFVTGNLIDGSTVERLTARRFFPSYFQTLPNGHVILRLGGAPPQQESGQGQQSGSGGR